MGLLCITMVILSSKKNRKEGSLSWGVSNFTDTTENLFAYSVDRVSLSLICFLFYKE